MGDMHMQNRTRARLPKAFRLLKRVPEIHEIKVTVCRVIFLGYVPFSTRFRVDTPDPDMSSSRFIEGTARGRKQTTTVVGWPNAEDRESCHTLILSPRLDIKDIYIRFCFE